MIARGSSLRGLSDVTIAVSASVGVALLALVPKRPSFVTVIGDVLNSQDPLTGIPGLREPKDYFTPDPAFKGFGRVPTDAGYRYFVDRLLPARQEGRAELQLSLVRREVNEAMRVTTETVCPAGALIVGAGPCGLFAICWSCLVIITCSIFWVARFFVWLIAVNIT